MRIKNIVLVEISILSLRVDLKYLDRIHGSKCNYYSRRGVFYLNWFRKVSSVFNWNLSRSSCKGGDFDELSTKKWRM